jgi:hypothetical protein
MRERNNTESEEKIAELGLGTSDDCRSITKPTHGHEFQSLAMILMFIRNFASVPVMTAMMMERVHTLPSANHNRQPNAVYHPVFPSFQAKQTTSLINVLHFIDRWRHQLGLTAFSIYSIYRIYRPLKNYYKKRRRV